MGVADGVGWTWGLLMFLSSLIVLHSRMVLPEGIIISVDAVIKSMSTTIAIAFAPFPASSHSPKLFEAMENLYLSCFAND
jgi:hypothetical protein